MFKTSHSSDPDLYIRQFGDYIMRSQLDCHDPRLPGTGVFDIKTRAALPIRVDLMNWEVRVNSL